MSRRAVFSRILKCLRPYWGYLLFTVLSALVVVAGQLLSPFFAGRAVDYAVGRGEVDFARLKLCLVGVLVSSAAAMVCQWTMSVSNNRVAYRVLSDLRVQTFEKLGKLPLRYIDDRAYGDILGVVVSDAEQFADGLLLGFTQLFTGGLTIVGVLGIMLAIRWEIALVVFLITPLSLFVARFIASRTYRTFRRQAEARADATAYADEMIGGLKTVKAFGREEICRAQFREKNETLRKTSLTALFFSSTTNPTTRFVNSLVYAAVALSGGFLVIATGGAFSVGYLSTFLSYANQYTKPFNEISEVIAEFQNALACAGRIFALLSEEEEPPDGTNELGRAKGDVSFENVSFCYDPARPLIEHFYLRVGAGMRVAIVGPTGCGKTTLVNLIMRFYDVQEGSICVDGEDIRTLRRASLRENIGMVLQDTWLKKATVRENLCLGSPGCTEEEMIAAAKAAKAHSFIMRLPDGYDTVVDGEGTLSAGQKQLLCIARVMLCRPPMLILDEATSNIDTRTERIVQQAFAALMRGRTCFIVAHRLSTVENADLILVMREGKIVERGKHADLLARGGLYAALYRAQFSK